MATLNLVRVLNNGSADLALSASAVAYATCATPAGTTAKVATLSLNGTAQSSEGFPLQVGATVIVKFTTTNADTVTAPTLNVNGTGAKAIHYAGAAYNDLIADHLYQFVYDGSYWVVMNPPLTWNTF